MEYLKVVEFLYFCKYHCDNEDYIEAAINASLKQIPKKPKRYLAFDGIERNVCPCHVENYILYAGQRFCSVCGQKILWEE